MKNIYKRAISDYKELVEKVKTFGSGLEKLCTELNGYNLQENTFDCNFKSITATIYYCNGELYVHNYIDIWNDEDTELIAECIHYSDIVFKAGEQK